MPAPRLAKSLAVLRDQIDKEHPDRLKVSDGSVASAQHRKQSPNSDHNEDSDGVVRALDITHDPAHGVDTWRMADVLRGNRDDRIAYVISNGRIFSSTVQPWIWRKYNGPNKHSTHMHISVKRGPHDDPTHWKLTGASVTPLPTVDPPKGITTEMRERMAKIIIDHEARRDANGNLAVYYPGDGSYEVAGINSTHHATVAAEFAALIKRQQFATVEKRAADWILNYTKHAQNWTEDAGVEFYLRDCIHHRGPTGAALILQKAVVVDNDGQIGPVTRDAIAAMKPLDLLLRIREAREDYEIEKYGKREKYWKGLQNRWDSTLKAAQAFHREATGPSNAVATAIVVGAGAAAGTTMAATTSTDTPWIVVAVVAAMVIAVSLIVLKRRG